MGLFLYKVQIFSNFMRMNRLWRENNAILVMLLGTNFAGIRRCVVRLWLFLDYEPE